MLLRKSFASNWQGGKSVTRKSENGGSGRGSRQDKDRMMEELNDSVEKMRQQLPERGALEETLMAKALKP